MMLRFWENWAWKFIKYMCTKTTFNETYLVHFLKNEAANEKIVFYIFYLFLNI